MKYKWLNQNNNKKLIIFFNGWGMDESVVNHLGAENYDILMFYDYNSLDINIDFEILNTYQEKNLIAWSMGVMVATKFCDKLNNLNQTVAINGTLKPIDIKFGIHPKIYDLTINGFNEKGRNRFINSMFNNKKELNISRSLEDQHSELIAIKNYSTNSEFKYNKILISDNDKIIPTKSQIEFWGKEANIQSGHCPFFIFKKWSELL